MSETQSGSKLPVENSLTLYQIKVKQEKFDPEVEAKINAISASNVVVKRESDKENKNFQNELNRNEILTDLEANGNGESSSDENEDKADSNDADSNLTEPPPEEDKKSIEPAKSSNEILAELFKVFNAAPPEELLDDKSLLKKSRKHKKHKKEKKKKLKREKDASEGEISHYESEVESNGSVDGKEKKYKHKHKKKKKHKQKDEKDKKRDQSKEKGKRDREKSKERQQSQEKSINTKKGNLKSTSRNLIRVDPSTKRQADLKITEAPFKKSRFENDRYCSQGTSREKSRDCDKYEQNRDKGNSRYQSLEKGNEKVRDRNLNSFYKGCSEYESSTNLLTIKNEPKDQRRSGRQDGHMSEISLSDDEEDYLKERHNDDTQHCRLRLDRDNERPHNSFYAGFKRSRSRDQDRNRNRDRERERERNYRSDGRSHPKERSRSCGRSRSRSRDLGIDKKRLLEIARKNAISMFKRGNLPGCDSMSQEVKDKVLLKMRYGGKTVQDLTDFCKKISNGENLSDLSSDEDSDVDKSGNTKAFHHPFQLKEREPIVMHIRNATTLPLRPTTSEAVKAITMQFPVSSGQQHRMTEAWVPVAQKDGLPTLPALPTATQSTNVFKTGVVKNVFEKTIPEEQQEPAFKPVQQAYCNNNGEITNNALSPVDNSMQAKVAAVTSMQIPKPMPKTVVEAEVSIDPVVTSKPFFTFPPPSVSIVTNVTSVPPPSLAQAFVPDVPVPSSTDAHISGNKVFPEQSGQQFDVSSIISKRLQAMRRLQENPMDPEAIKMMYNSQKDMSSWASSKHLPGQFTGSTGANILTMRELTSGPQAWARRDQLTTSRPVSGGMGMQLLQKMGWKPGEGLGRDKSGSLQPLLLDVKLDKHGLVARDDNNGYKQKITKKQRPQNVVQQQGLLEKHPVCLLNELTSKRKWTPPLYSLVNEAGPSHSRMFLFSVSINGQTYTPSQGSNTKKEAKLITARHCLQQMGILPA
ncbi:protein SON [Ceratitis capitata]|uniref:protein SON n=1 Tax=Ceratitis capitata TaxID=7213 RepID=UPI00032A20A9|nr:protein SON [Ceratitis capitata]